MDREELEKEEAKEIISAQVYEFPKMKTVKQTRTRKRYRTTRALQKYSVVLQRFLFFFLVLW